ncbi:hypothetical protein C5F51_22195 [Nocardia nova]|uniref:Mammalian cell entry protein n=1 Tax=Nocardia nova TaxID=37330 RepID=A0A2S6A1Y8_9NOCA|nr:hypothetical protein C5F51_22195 [Nocardia nova]
MTDPGADTVEQRTCTTKSGWRFAVTAIALSVLVVAIIGLTVAATLMQFHMRATDSDTDRDAEVVATARRMVTDLTTLNQGGVDGSIKRILDETTGSFRDQFSHQADSFRQVVAKGGVDSTAQVTEAGLVDADDDHAQVLVASTSTVKNTDAPNGQQRLYRMKVSLQHVGATWLISDVEFVS